MKKPMTPHEYKEQYELLAAFRAGGDRYLVQRLLHPTRQPLPRKQALIFLATQEAIERQHAHDAFMERLRYERRLVAAGWKAPKGWRLGYLPHEQKGNGK